MKLKRGDTVLIHDNRTGREHLLRYVGSKEYGLKLLFEPLSGRIPTFAFYKSTIDMRKVHDTI